MQAADRYVVRRNREAPGLWDVIDTMHDNTPVLGGEALPEMQARELAERLNRYYREWREGR